MLTFIIRRYKWTIESLELVKGLFRSRNFGLDGYENKGSARKLAMTGYCWDRRD